jgi:LuxR family transcriptional regulator, maltose regulon positive regulatory protein
MENLVTRTKIIAPRRRTDLLTRQRLLDILHELIDYKLIILVAPAGYGKTILLVDFAHNTELPVCWYALDPLDQDAHRFFVHFITTIATRFPDFGRSSLTALQSMSAGQGSLEQLVTTIVNDLYDHVQEHFVVVIDDYHLVDQNGMIGDFISRFVQQVDENCHLVLASRKLLSIPNMALLIARGYVGGLDFEDLIFERAEIQQLVLQNYGKSISTVEAEALFKATEGWITGLLLSTHSKLHNISGRMRIMRASGLNLYDYLAQQVLDQQPPPLREFLLRTSLLEEFDGALCELVFGSAWQPVGETWQSLLTELSQRNLFVLPVGENGNALRYHLLFQEFLQKKLVTERPDEESAILRRLAAVYTEREEWEKAHRVYQRLDDLAAIAALIEQAGLALLNAGRTQLLATWLFDLPTTFLQARPALLSLKGEVLSRQGEVQQALLLFNQAEHALRNDQDSLHLAYTLVRRAVVYRLLGDYQASIDDTDGALTLIQESDAPANELATIKALGLRSKGQSLYSSGNLGDSIDFLKEARHVFQTLADAQSVAAVSTDIAVMYTAQGQHAQAFSLFQSALQVWRTLANISAQATVLNNLGVLFHLQGDYEQALALLEESHLCAERSGYKRFVSFSLTGLGDLLIDLEMWTAAQSLYRQALEVAQKINEQFMLLYLKLALARIASATNNPEQAFEHLDAVSKMMQDHKSDSEWGLYQLAMGRYYLAQDKPRAAIEPLLNAQKSFGKSGQPIEEASTHFLLAAACQAANRPEQMQTHLTLALNLAFTIENRHPLIVTLRPLKNFLRLVQVEAFNAERIKRIGHEIEKFEHTLVPISRRLRQAFSPTLLALLADVPPKLTIRALGRVEVLIDGKVINNSEWQTVVARDLFFCLLAHPTGLTKEEVGMFFWPDASPTELKTRFKNAIYRLRGALNQDVILFENESYRFNQAIDYEYDLEAFLQKVAEGKRAAEPTMRMVAYQAAAELYRGAYLPEIAETWVWAERERIQQSFVEMMLALAQLQFEAEDYQAALESCQRLLADDPCLEDAHRLSMRIHAANGNQAGVARQFAQCRRALEEEIDALPSLQTEELYALLMRRWREPS